MVKLKENILRDDIFCILTDAVGWGTPPKEQVKKAIENSLYNVCAIMDDKVVGMGRLCGDRSLFYYIKDLVVLPEYQEKGIGALLIKNIIDYIKNNTPNGWKVSVELMSAKGKESFYKKFGFESRPNENFGSGMFMMISC